MSSLDQRATILKHKAEEIAKKLMKAEGQAGAVVKPTAPKVAFTSTAQADNTVQWHPSEYRLFVKNLSAETTEETLKAYFGRWGKVVDVFIRQSQFRFAGQHCNMGNGGFDCFFQNCVIFSRIPAYITYHSLLNVSPLDCYMHVIDGFSVTVDKLKTMPNSKYEVAPSSKSIMITGTIQDIKDVDLVEFFSSFGKLVKLTRKRDPKDPKKYQRFAFLVFEDHKSVDKVMLLSKLVLKGQVMDARRVKDLA